jgi:hypothetical protein
VLLRLLLLLPHCPPPVPPEARDDLPKQPSRELFLVRVLRRIVAVDHGEDGARTAVSSGGG